MRSKFSILIFSALMLLIALSACAPASPQVAAPTQAPASPEAVSGLATSTAEPPTAAAPAQQPSATAELAVLPSPTPEPAAPWVSYIGGDGNLWLINPARGEMRQITQDAQALQPGLPSVDYCCGVWSSDGQYMAYTRQTGTPVAEGYQYAFSLWVFDLASGQSREVLANQQTAGFSWRPGTHMLTYGLTIPHNYFAVRGSVDSTLASGIWAVDVDSGAVSELVKPERGFTMVNPRWAPDGQTVGFEEVLLMEGRGNFAYYDTTTQQYSAWDKAIGSYHWSPDGETLYYDYLNYAPSGTERIFRNNRQNTAEQQISPDYANGYAFWPLLTPDGSQVIYAVEEMLGEGRSRYQVVIQPSTGGDARVLGEFEQPGELSLSPDGSLLLLAAGSYDNRQIQLVKLADGSTRTLVQGRQPEWQPVNRLQATP